MSNFNKIKILDCTLRDGGYINNWEFPIYATKKIITSLIDAKIEIIECGFLNQKIGTGFNSTLFNDFFQVNELIDSIDRNLQNTNFCVMINKGDYDFDTLPNYNENKGVINMIRYAFHKKDWQDAIIDMKTMINKGYKVYVQPMVTLSYSEKEITQMIYECNKLDIYAMYIVDSFGAMYGDDFDRLHNLFEDNLKKGVNLGYHSHNNLQLAYSNAINFVQNKNTDRDIIIDSSILGMGRGAGNLTTELIADYMNKKEIKQYNIIPLLDTIDKYLETIYRESYWGYSIAHFLSASFGCHPNYSSFLINKKNLSIIDIKKILSLLDDLEKKNFNKERIEELYINFKSNTSLPTNFNADFFKNKKILILASGSNLIKQKRSVMRFIDDHKPLVVAVNHIPKNIKIDLCFFSNQKRYDKFIEHINPNKIIITTNIKVTTNISNYKVVDYYSLTTKTSNKNDNVTILLLNLLIEQKVKEVFIAGFDGYKFDSDNYSYSEYDKIVERKVMKNQNKNILTSIKEIRQKLSINFITDSVFK